MGRVFTSFILALAILTSSCERESKVGERARHTPQGPRVVIIVLDACRADKLGCYGFARETSPSIDAFAADPDAVLFRRHYVQSTWTKPSTASLFTGLFVRQHGVVMGHRGTNPRDGKLDRLFTTQVLDGKFVTLAERLRSKGFTTVGVVKSYHLVRAYGFAQGFQHYHSPLDTPGGDPGRVRTFINLLGQTEGPLFGYLHINACHNPFRPSDRDAAYMERYGFEYDEASRRAVGIDFTDNVIKEGLRSGVLRLDADDQRFLNLVYEAKLRQTDELLFRPLIEGLRATGQYDGSLIILTADHGEELYEHQGYAHGHALWEEVIRVPMIVKFPKGQRPKELSREHDGLTQSVDLLPSIMSFVGASTQESLPGQPIFAGAVDQGAYAEHGDKEQDQVASWALVQGDDKLLEGRGNTLLFDLKNDPGERRNLASRRPQRVAAMRAAVRKLSAAAEGAARAPAIETELAPAVIEQLRNLGYLPPKE